MDFAPPTPSSDIFEEYKTFSFILNNIEYIAVIAKFPNQIKIKISYQKDLIKKEYEDYFTLNDIHKLNEAFVKFKSTDEFYIYFISNFSSGSKIISIYNNILNLIIVTNKDNLSLTIFHLKEIEIKLNDIYNLLLKFINNNKMDFNHNKNEIQNNKKNEEKKNDLSQQLITELLNQNSKIQQDIISINQNIVFLKNSIDSIQKYQIKNNQNTMNDQNNKQTKELEDKINILSKENKELREELTKEKNKDNFEKPKKGKEELIQPKNIIKNKNENLIEENKENIITAKFNITDPNENVRIMNYKEKNKNKLSEMFDIYIDNTQIPFSWKHQFSSGGMHFVKYKLKKSENNSINMSGMFEDCKFLKSVDFSNFDLTYVTDMSYMFYSCVNFNIFTFGKNKTNNIYDISHMFDNCEILTVLDLSNLNTVNVVNMAYMFSNCRNLRSLDLTGLNTENVTDMSYMFFCCCQLESLNLSNFNTNEVTNMSNMFYCCSKLISLDLSKFNIINVANMYDMFNYCHKITIIIDAKDIYFSKKLKEMNIKYKNK